jgi:hypothetical protein
LCVAAVDKHAMKTHNPFAREPGTMRERKMLRRLCSWVVCAACLAPLASAAETGEPSLGSVGPALGGTAVGGATTAGGSALDKYWVVSESDDKKSAFVFMNLEIVYPLTPRMFSVHFPLEGAEKAAKITVFVEGAVSYREIDASLITIVNGTAHVLDFAKLAAEEKEPRAGDCSGLEKLPRDLAAAKRAALAKDNSLARESSLKAGGQTIHTRYAQCVALETPSASELRTNLILLMNSQSTGGHGYVNATTITYVIEPLTPAPK